MSSAVLTSDLVRLDVECGGSVESVARFISELVVAQGRAKDVDLLFDAVCAREFQSPTGIPGGVAIPHCRCATVVEPTLCFVRLSNPVDFSGPDGASDLVFFIAVPDSQSRQHMVLLSKLARALLKKDFVAALRAVSSPDEAVALIEGVFDSPTPPKNQSTSAPRTGIISSPSGSLSNSPEDHPVGGAHATDTQTFDSPQSLSSPYLAPDQEIRIVAVTACPTGIAHTYMAADALVQASESMPGVTVMVETQGSSAYNSLSSTDIAHANAVIFATDVGVKDRERFAGKPVIESGVKKAIHHPKQLLESAALAVHDPHARRVSAGPCRVGDESHGVSTASGLSIGKRLQQAVMTGVSYMVPFVAAGGLLIGLGFLFGGYDMAPAWKEIVLFHSLSTLPGSTIEAAGYTITTDRSGFMLYFGAVLFGVGQSAMSFIVAALSGYIAFALAGRPGIAPGFIGGSVSVLIGAGFLGGLVTGVLSGLIAMGLARIKVHRVVNSLMPVVIIPFVTSMLVGVSMFFFLGRPLHKTLDLLQMLLGSMSGTSAMVLGAVLGVMMCFDLGGPVNKAAYLFATAGLSTGDKASLAIMAAVMVAGMVPPIAMSIATLIRRNLFSAAEQENAKSAWLLGCAFISEGAIPFAAADPLRVIPSLMLGGATAGALSMGFGVGSRAPHGGMFVFFAVEPLWAWFVALGAGVIVSAVAVLLLKQFWPSKALQT
ncbi:fructose-specific PTS transporter subunit EIIC [Corynebacterium felinum]|uniref:PTS system fructose-specific IIC component n=1 Tax=Corynebacterium felinum TaxID=131318 RepID=A0ABU2BD25_9CORY|nr:fructose-specific PTS transporter subunit EIIC [Corynebacterium felinum]MDF5821329.1 fructose-specific PTS transporter subunit EIIC [Corynebacterium felinum]MDR7355874.1 PTS system fructose-specific IIC component [Corynebacterium felinum]WJY95217.1 PTS system fructose-specific EIIABC component [Corynebacterium felinum]